MSGQNVFVTGDWHLNHWTSESRNIIKYCGRPFEDVEEMNETIRNNHNSLVKPGDIVYYLGDLILGGSWIDIKNTFNGDFVYVWGNHDRKRFADGTRPPRGIYIKFNNKNIYMTHFPTNLPKGFDVYFTAHSHNSYKFGTSENGLRILNVGVDVWNFKPVNIKRAIAEYENINNWYVPDSFDKNNS